MLKPAILEQVAQRLRLGRDREASRELNRLNPALKFALFGRRTWLGLRNRHLFDQFHQFDPSAVEAHKESAS